MSPCVVLAWKLGASEPRRRRGCSVGVARKRRNMGEMVCLEAKVGRVMGRRVVVVAARRALRENAVAIVEYDLWSIRETNDLRIDKNFFV